MSITKAAAIALSFALLVIFLASGASADFSCKVVPNGLDERRDWWYLVPPEDPPYIPVLTKVVKGQQFQIPIFFAQAGKEPEKVANINYQIKVFAPDGKTVFDTGIRGTTANRSNLVTMEQELLQMTFDSTDPMGVYSIEVTATDEQSANTSKSTAKVELVSWEARDYFGSKEEAGEWTMGYARNPDPSKSVNAYLKYAEFIDGDLSRAIPGLYFFSKVFEKNPYLLLHLVSELAEGDKRTREKIFFMLHVQDRPDLLPDTQDKELLGMKKYAEQFNRMNPYANLDSPIQLDMLWSEFFATGRYAPLKALVRAFEYEDYSTQVKALDKEELKKLDRGIAAKYAIFESALWSATSMVKQNPLVASYFKTLSSDKSLSERERKWVAVVLDRVKEDK